MPEAETVRVQELPLEPEIARDSVLSIPGDRQPDRAEVDSDLMCAAGLEPDLEERVLARRLLKLEVRHRLARLVGVQRASGRVAAVAPDRRVDPPRARPWVPADEREDPVFAAAFPIDILSRLECLPEART